MNVIKEILSTVGYMLIGGLIGILLLASFYIVSIKIISQGVEIGIKHYIEQSTKDSHNHKK